MHDNKTEFEKVCQIYTKKHIAHILGEPYELLEKLARNAHSHYHPFDKVIPEKNKIRHIDNPDKHLKRIQKKIEVRILRKAPLPMTMLGGVKKKGIIDNASLHTGQRVVIGIDLKNCFPNTKHTYVYNIYRNTFKCSALISSLLTKLTTFQGYLPQGSPCSNTLANLVLATTYIEIEGLCKKEGLKSSIWVDDITISGEKADTIITRTVKIIQKNGYAVSNKKIKVMRSNAHQEVTGITVNRKLTVPKQKTRAWTIQLIKESTEGKDPSRSLLGKLQHLKYVEPLKHMKLIERLTKNYGGPRKA